MNSFNIKTNPDFFLNKFFSVTSLPLSSSCFTLFLWTFFPPLSSSLFLSIGHHPTMIEQIKPCKLMFGLMLQVLKLKKMILKKIKVWWEWWNYTVYRFIFFFWVSLVHLKMNVKTWFTSYIVILLPTTIVTSTFTKGAFGTPHYMGLHCISNATPCLGHTLMQHLGALAKPDI